MKGKSCTVLKKNMFSLCIYLTYKMTKMATFFLFVDCFRSSGPFGKQTCLGVTDECM